MVRGKHSGKVTLLWLLLTLSLIAASVGGGPASADQVGLERSSVREVAPPVVDDLISDAELQDLETIASQSGISLHAAIDRYAWNDNFALAVASIREALPGAFTGAEIVNADHAWVAFAGRAPEAARDMIDTFSSTHSDVSVDLRTDLGFTEVELEGAIETVHFAVLGTPEVRDASTSYDFETGQITTTVVLEDTASDSVLDDLRVVAVQSLIDATREDILDSITISVVRSPVPVIGGVESSSEHLGGEVLSTCTSGFGTKTSSGVRGISTAGHCNNSQSDDGSSLTYKGQSIGGRGDFQYHTGPEAGRDDFYSGSSSSTEVNRRDVSSVGSSVTGQSLCRNGMTSHKDCQEVRKLNVCKCVVSSKWGSICLRAAIAVDLCSGATSHMVSIKAGFTTRSRLLTGKSSPEPISSTTLSWASSLPPIEHRKACQAGWVT